MKTNCRERRSACRYGNVAAVLPIISAFLFLVGVLAGCGSAAELAGAPRKAADLYQLTKVWAIHLHFTPDQWQAMEPEQGDGPMGGPMRMRFGGPAGPDGPGGFGAAGFLVPSFLKADQDHDGALSKEEFRALGEQWFSQWDKNRRGEVTLEQLQNGITSSLALPQFGRPGGGGGPPLQASEGHRNGLAGASGIDFKYVHADLEFEGQMFRDVAVRYKGNGTFMESRGSLKRSLKIDLNKYVKGQKLAGQTKLNLHNNVTDASWMNEVLSYKLFRDAGVPAPRTAYAKVFVTVPGKYDKQYFGLYSLVEDVDSHFAKDRFGTKEGAIFKPVTHDLFNYEGDDWSTYNHTYDPKTELSSAEQRRVVDFSKLVTSASDADFSARIAEFLDLEEFARFMSVEVWLSTLDSILMMGQNFYVYLHPDTHKFQFVPWDLDHSFGQFPMGGSQDQREKLSIQKPWRGTNRFLERVFSSDVFKKLYLAKMTEFAKTIFLPGRFNRQVDEVAAAIRPAVGEESDVKLARFDKVVAGESVDRFGFGGGPGRGMGRGDNGPRRFGPGGFGQAAKPIKGFVTARAQSVNEQLAGKSGDVGDSEFGFGFGRPRDRFMGGGPGGPNLFGPGTFVARNIMDSFDIDKNGKLTHQEVTAGFAKWFDDWNTDKSGKLSEQQLRKGINRDLSPFRGGPPPGGPDFGPPDGDRDSER